MKKISLFMACLFLAACSGKPSDRQIEQLVSEALLSDGGAETYSVSDFEKTNGLAKNEQFYIADVRYQLTFKKSFDELSDQVINTPSESPFETVGAGFKLMTMRMQYGDFKKGDSIVKEDRVQLIKTEQGWRLDDY
ncbi:hypothetical protein [Zhongshania sp. BJYM1]|jgi:hypothetical protein|uniref:hypothetical protein n=1 Tax=Zhongshania aquatica TaxID=2965069 RepID=UPI0022B43B26|nr:hypothetical protein [Marortus sp. BJYM1]